jgi:hypothetical protein
LQIEIYIMTAGYGTQQDYRWRQVAADGLQAVGDALTKLESLQRLVNSHKNINAVLERRGDLLHLVVSGIPTNRQDYVHRRITIDLALTGPDDPDVSRLFRGILAEVLSDSDGFSQQMDNLVVDARSSSVGWIVKQQELETWILSKAAKSTHSEEATDGKAVMAPYDTVNRERLSFELTGTPLPSRQGALVLIADYQDEKSLSALQPWRALSSMVTQAADIPPYRNAVAVASQLQNNQHAVSSSDAVRWLIIATAAIAGLVLLYLMLFARI